MAEPLKAFVARALVQVMLLAETNERAAEVLRFPDEWEDYELIRIDTLVEIKPPNEETIGKT